MTERVFTHHVLRRIAPPGAKETHTIVYRARTYSDARVYLTKHWEKEPQDPSEYSILNLNTWEEMDLPPRPETT